MRTREFTLKQKADFNAFWMSLRDRGLESTDCALACEPGEFSTRWIRGEGWVVKWREFQ